MRVTGLAAAACTPVLRMFSPRSLSAAAVSLPSRFLLISLAESSEIGLFAHLQNFFFFKLRLGGTAAAFC